MTIDHMRTLTRVEVIEPYKLDLAWSDGARAVVDLGQDVLRQPYVSLADPAVFRQVHLGKSGHSIEWPNGSDIGAHSLWLDTLTVTGRGDARAVFERRMRNGLTLPAAAEALGIPRGRLAAYSNGDKPVPKAIMLALRGWEALQAA